MNTSLGAQTLSSRKSGEIGDDVVKAKLFLMKHNSTKGDGSLYDHLAVLIKKLIIDKPDNALDYFEIISKELREEKFQPQKDYLQDLYVPKDLSDVNRLINLYKEMGVRMELEIGGRGILQEATAQVISEKEIEIPNLFESNNYFRLCGFGLLDDEVFKISLALRKLVRENPIEKIRFFGKIFGTLKDYYVAEAELTDEEIEKRIKVMCDSVAPSKESLRTIMSNRVSEIIKSLTSTESSSLYVDAVDFCPGEGCNRKVYWVCNELDEDWICLPDVEPKHIIAARQINKYMTGDLATEMCNFPPFNGTEKQFLRAQLARLSAATSVSPMGYFKLRGEDFVEDTAEVAAVDTAVDVATSTVSTTVDVIEDAMENTMMNVAVVDSVLDAAEDAVVDTEENAAEENTEDIAEDVSEDDMEDAVVDKVVDATEDTVEDNAVDATEDTEEDNVVDASEDNVEDNVVDASEDTVGDKVVDASEDAMVENVVDATEDAVTDTADNTTKNVTEDVKEEAAEDALEDVDKEAAEGTEEDVAEDMAENAAVDAMKNLTKVGIQYEKETKVDVLIKNKEYKGLKMMELMDKSLCFWVHHEGQITEHGQMEPWRPVRHDMKASSVASEGTPASEKKEETSGIFFKSTVGASLILSDFTVASRVSSSPQTSSPEKTSVISKKEAEQEDKENEETTFDVEALSRSVLEYPLGSQMTLPVDSQEENQKTEENEEKEDNEIEEDEISVKMEPSADVSKITSIVSEDTMTMDKKEEEICVQSKLSSKSATGASLSISCFTLPSNESGISLKEDKGVQVEESKDDKNVQVGDEPTVDFGLPTLTEDSTVGGAPAWGLRAPCSLVGARLTALHSRRWWGAHAYATAEGKFDNMYIGWGIKYNPDSHASPVITRTSVNTSLDPGSRQSQEQQQKETSEGSNEAPAERGKSREGSVKSRTSSKSATGSNVISHISLSPAESEFPLPQSSSLVISDVELLDKTEVVEDVTPVRSDSLKTEEICSSKNLLEEEGASSVKLNI